MPTRAETGNACHERARRVVFGYLAPAMLHETNNVLTVMAGVRQLLRSGQSLSDRVGTMIDQQLARMDELVGSIRRVGPEEADPSEGVRDVSFVVEAVARIVQLVGKGRGLTLERDPQKVSALPRDSEALALATLCALLPALPRRGRASGTRVLLRAAARDGEVWIETEVRLPDGSDAGADAESSGGSELEVVRALLDAAGGRIEARVDGAVSRARVSMACAT
jgi:hypothetical protein